MSPSFSALSAHLHFLSSQLHPGELHLHQHPPSRLAFRSLPLRLRLRILGDQFAPLALPSPSSGINNDNGNNNDDDDDDDDDGSGGSGGGGEAEDDGGASDGQREEALFVLAQLGRKIESIPSDLVAAIEGNRATGEIVRRFIKMESSPLLRWLLEFRGVRERLLADDLFLAKLIKECDVGVIVKTAAEYEKRKENFADEIDIIISDVVTVIVADVMLAYLPAATAYPHSPLGTNQLIAGLSHNWPNLSSQLMFGAILCFLVGRPQTIARVYSMLSAVGTIASPAGTGISNAMITARKAFVKEHDDRVEQISGVSTPDKVEKKWWSCFQAEAEFSAGLVLTHSPMHGGRFHPEAMAKVSAGYSRGSRGRSR